MNSLLRKFKIKFYYCFETDSCSLDEVVFSAVDFDSFSASFKSDGVCSFSELFTLLASSSNPFLKSGCAFSSFLVSEPLSVESAVYSSYWRQFSFIGIYALCSIFLFRSLFFFFLFLAQWIVFDASPLNRWEMLSQCFWNSIFI